MQDEKLFGQNLFPNEKDINLHMSSVTVEQRIMNNGRSTLIITVENRSGKRDLQLC